MMANESSKRIDVVQIKMIRERSTLYSPRRITSAHQVAELAEQEIGDSDREKCLVICMNAKSEPLKMQIVSIGSLSGSIVHPREVFKIAILSNAYAILLVHNHPSGDTTPSSEDEKITKRLKGAGEIIGIPLIDHVIIGNQSYTSMKELGYL